MFIEPVLMSNPVARGFVVFRCSFPLVSFKKPRKICPFVVDKFWPSNTEVSHVTVCFVPITQTVSASGEVTGGSITSLLVLSAMGTALTVNARQNSHESARRARFASFIVMVV